MSSSIKITQRGTLLETVINDVIDYSLIGEGRVLVITTRYFEGLINMVETFNYPIDTLHSWHVSTRESP